MRYRRNVYSQNGEDGIVAEIIDRIGVQHPGTFVEFGTGNGVDLSNSLMLAEYGWSGVWIEQNEESFKKTAALAEKFGGRVEALYGTVGFGHDDNLNVFLGKTKMPRDIDLMSIDIDSFDLQVWQALDDVDVIDEHCGRRCQFRPKVVIIEINSGVPLGVRQVHESGRTQGASFTSMVELAHGKGYRLVAHTGNLIFVDGGLAKRLDMPASELAEPDTIFNDMWARWAADQK